MRIREESYGYQVRFAPETLAAMRVEAVRMAEERGPVCETGGLLLGQIDHSARVVWVTEADSLPPESQAAAHELTMSPRSADAYVDKRRRQTHGLVGYVGAWHTHPGVTAEASDLDRQALKKLTSDGAPCLLVIVGGPVEVWETWLDGTGRPHVHARLAFPYEDTDADDPAREEGDRGDS
ncbi:Mov34/MPN/PAD-1 family protein [Kibdelosporangium lantanae]|uniref:Mov34/MPN/PAD-1 family protein n=1 Tax=Kibdelosporangium lantanae TaxID=1497396 RepID=A0ABW3M4H3_9PSEU